MVPSDLCPYLEKNKTRINKKLGHLTYSRLTKDEQWDFAAIRDEVSQAWCTFLGKLQDHQRSWFGQVAEAAESSTSKEDAKLYLESGPFSPALKDSLSFGESQRPVGWINKDFPPD